ncbi:EAL domain-containing protein [Luteimonas yindakuii]|uniref:cyclic-guanylate-specific phosphodiesterase n=1 Tax=Luteimonas yindakuii TaxID=2565782 RepID=A0A4Z1R657_9GAMM|nr:EAL domain-containing protein [Luteimonas yindakuii]TKS54015.1 EAL domain-containing protein [Luteimonas yindakuii]
MHRRFKTAQSLNGSGIFAAAVVAGSILLTLLLAHAAWVQGDRHRLERHVDRLLEATRLVATQSTRALNDSLRLTTARCSADDLTELRVLAFQSQHIRDIGRVEDGRVLCTAAWGVLPHPPLLPEPTRRATAYRFWSVGSTLVDRRISTDMVAAGDAILFVAPDWFGDIARLDPRTSSIVTTRDRRHVMRAWGSEATILPGAREEPWHDLGSARVQLACDDDYDLCVMARTRGSGLADASLQSVLGLCLLGGLAGMGINSMMGASRRRRASLEARLARVIRTDRLHMVYQPLRRLSDRGLVGFEALVRWTTSSGDDVPPEVFVRMAEQTGLGRALARQVVAKAFAEMAPTLQRDSGLYLGINLTAEDLLDMQFHDYLDAQAALHGIAAASIVLEITERSTAMRDDLVRNIHLLRAKGYRFYIDDFGTGYSSLDYLAALPLDAVKIDKLFTQAAGSDSVVGQIFEPMCTMAHALRVGIVVEGVETEQQAEHVCRLAPQAIGQGWLLGRPVAVQDLPTT